MTKNAELAILFHDCDSGGIWGGGWHLNSQLIFAQEVPNLILDLGLLYSHMFMILSVLFTHLHDAQL